MLIGLSGWAQSGKDTTADVLVEMGFKKIAYADPLREFLEKQNPDVRMDSAPIWSPLSSIIKAYGWDGYKKSPYVGHMRALVQRTGTEAGRGVLGDTVWIDETYKRVAQYKDVVISDCRFPNEADAVREHGGKVIRVTRPGNKPANSHASETSLDDYVFDGIINNAGTIADLKRKLQHFLS